MSETVVIVAGPASEHAGAIAAAFAARGAHVFTTGDVPTGTPAVRRRSIDIADPAALETLAREAVAERGRIDVWVNDPGAAAAEGRAETLAPERWNEIARAVVEPVVHGARIAGRHMLEHERGVIVNLISVDAVLSTEGRALTGAAMGALTTLTRALGVEWAARGIRVVGVSIVPSSLASPADHDDYARRRIPLGRPGDPDEIAQALMFLVGDEAAYVVGEVLPADGGWSSYHMF